MEYMPTGPKSRRHAVRLDRSPLRESDGLGNQGRLEQLPELERDESDTKLLDAVEEIGTSTVESEGGTLDVTTDTDGKTQVDLDLKSNEGQEILQVTNASIKEKDPKYKQMRVLMYTPSTGQGHALDELSGGSKVEDRLKLLEANLAKAMEAADKAGDGPDVLRIFMAPEWFFSHKTTAYDPRELSAAIKGLEAISKRHANVLMIPGSILWTADIPAPPSPTKPEKKSWSPFGEKEKAPTTAPDKRGKLLHNTTGAFMGGEALTFYSKQRDGTDARSNTPQTPTLALDGPKFSDWLADPTRQTPRHKAANGHTFELDGLTLGLEICADNGSGLLMRELHEQDPKHQGVDLHLITSCGLGMGPSAPTSAAKEGGYTLMADGARTTDTNARKMKQVAQTKSRDGDLVTSAQKQFKDSRSQAVELDEQQMIELEAQSLGKPTQNTANLLQMTKLLDLPGR